MLKVLLYTATFNEIHEQQFTITIINYKSVMYQSTGNKQLEQPLTAAPPTAHFNNSRFSITTQYCQPQYLIASTGEW